LARQGQGSLPTPSASQAAASLSNGSPDERALIVPGQKVGSLQLGNTGDQSLKLLGPKKEEYNYDNPCKYSEMHWYDMELDTNGIFVYLKDGKIFQLEAATPRYRTAEGITEESSPDVVRRRFPQLRSYVLLNSGSDIVGGRDLIYWVDRADGIAFEFYYNRKAKKRRVSKVIIFNPNSEFQPEGCVSPP
jgi:hypothetical protein